MTAPLLEVEDLKVAYHRNAVALHGVSLKVLPQAIAAILGNNGAGKTTTLRALSGMVRATGLPKESFCMACYNGKYPVPYDPVVDKHIMERRRARIEGLVEGIDKDAMQIKLL